MTTTQIIVVWILFLIAGLMINWSDLREKAVGGTILMIVVSGFATLFMMGFTFLGTM